MKNIITGLLAVFVFTGWAGSASAAFVTVTVNGNEWIQPVDVTGFTWNDFNAVCPSASGGVCNSNPLGGSGPVLAGYTWASVDDVTALFNYFIGSNELGPAPDSHVEVASAWAPAFFEEFEPTYGNTTNYLWLLGHTRTTEANSPDIVMSPYLLDNFSDTIIDRAVTGDTWPINYSLDWVGGYFYKPSPVPLPAAAWLFGSALFGLVAVKRRKA